MVTVASSPFMRLVERKKIGDHQKWHMKRAGSQDVVTVGRVDDSSDGNVELSGGIKNGVGGYVRREHHTMLSPSTIAAATTL